MKSKVAGVLVLFVLAFGMTTDLFSQDRRWVKMWERAQRDRPESIGPVGRIASETEPGTPLVIHGRVYAADGVTPAPGVIVFAYQTDETGVYHERGASDWRLRGWARTDPNGRFELRTIRPESYPSGRTPAHVHFTIDGKDLPRRWAEELRFGDDPYISRTERREAASAERFTGTRPVTTRGDVQHVYFNIRITNEGLF